MTKDSKLTVHIRVLFALVMREMTTRYGQNMGGYVWAVLEPAGTLAMLTLVFSLIARRPAIGDSFPIFFATGFLAFHFYMDISRSISKSVKSNRTLLTFPRVTITDAIIARLILRLITLIFVSVLIISVLTMIYDDPITIDFQAIFVSIFLSSFLGLSIGIVNCFMFSFSSTWETFFMIINRPLLLVSGIFYVYEDLPSSIQDIIWWNPLIHVTAIMRSGFYAIYDPTWVQPLYVFFLATIPFFLGILLIRLRGGVLLER